MNEIVEKSLQILRIRSKNMVNVLRKGAQWVWEKVKSVIPLSWKRKIDGNGSESKETTSNPEGMQSQSLVQSVEKFENKDRPFGYVRMNWGLRDRLLNQLSNHVDHLLKERFKLKNQRDLEKDIEDFYELLKENPARGKTHGATGNGKALWLHLLARQLQPDTVVESGVYVGRSLYTLRKAAPSAALYAFDVSFDPLQFRNDSIHYHECDWSNIEVKCDR